MKKALAVLLLLSLLCPLAASAETVVTSFYPVWLMALNLTEGIDGITVANPVPTPSWSTVPEWKPSSRS